jgi:hypothetical protein
MRRISSTPSTSSVAMTASVAQPGGECHRKRHRLRLHAVEHQQQRERQHADHHGLQLALGGERADLALHRELAAHRQCGALERFGEAAARLVGDPHRGDDQGQRGQAHAFGEMVERLVEREAEAVFAQGEVELLGDRWPTLAHELLQRHRHRHARAQAAGDDLQRVGQLLFDQGEPASAQQPEGETRQQREGERWRVRSVARRWRASCRCRRR